MVEGTYGTTTTSCAPDGGGRSTVRRNIFLFLALIIVLTPLVAFLPEAPASSSTASAATNRIQNPGFEEPSTGGVGDAPDDWTASTTSPFRGNGTSVYAGDFSAYLHGTSGSYSQTITIVASAVYLFEAYSRANGSATETVEIVIYNNVAVELDRFTWTGTNHGWLRRAAYFTTAENADNAEITLSISGDSSAEAWFDGLALQERSPLGCFIATAAYGSYADDHVDTLRDFRDSRMETNSVGSALVSAYYKVSPPVARFIDDHPSLKPAVRAGLLPAVGLSTTAVGTTFTEKAAIAGSTLLISGLMAVWLRRRVLARAGSRATVPSRKPSA
jgi:hypothetical protein